MNQTLLEGHTVISFCICSYCNHIHVIHSLALATPISFQIESPCYKNKDS